MIKRYCDICYKEIEEYTNYTKIKILPQIKIDKYNELYTEKETLEVCKECMVKIRKSIYNIRQECKMGYRE